MIYKELRQERSHLLTITISVKTYPINCQINKNIFIQNENGFDFDNFIKKRMLRAPKNESRFTIKCNGLVLSPIFEDFDLGYLLLIKTNILDTLSKVGMNISKYKLIIKEKGSKFNLRVDCSKCTIDLFSNYNKKSTGQAIEVKKNIYYKMRMVILFENVVYDLFYDENVVKVSVSISKVNFFLLRNLDHGANKLLFLNIPENDFKGNFYLTRYGFTEVVYFDSVFFQLKKNSEKTIEVEFVNEVIEVTFCRDSLRCIKQFLNSIEVILKDLYGYITSNNVEKNDHHLNHHKTEKLIEYETKFNLNRKKPEDEINLEFRTINDKQFDFSENIEKNYEKTQNVDVDFSKNFFFLFKFIKIFLYEGKDFVFEDVFLSLKIEI